MTWLIGQVVFAVHWLRIIEGGIEKSVDVFHEGALHFPFALRLWWRNKDGLLALVALA